MTFWTYEVPRSFLLPSSVWRTKNATIQFVSFYQFIISKKYGKSPGRDVIYGIPVDDLVAASAAFMEEPAWFDRSGTLGWSCTSGRSARRWQGRNMNVVVSGCAAYHINKPPQCIILWPSGLDRCPEQRDWKSFESGVQSRTYMKWKLPTALPVNTNQAGKAVGAIG